MANTAKTTLAAILQGKLNSRVLKVQLQNLEAGLSRGSRQIPRPVLLTRSTAFLTLHNPPVAGP